MRIPGNQPTIKPRHWLHLLLVIGSITYLFSPLLDHWLGHGGSVRPHNHVPISHEIVGHSPEHAAFFTGFQLASHDHEHDEGFLCLLDFDLLFVAVLLVGAAWAGGLIPRTPLASGVSPKSSHAFTLFLPCLVPPPRIS